MFYAEDLNNKYAWPRFLPLLFPWKLPQRKVMFDSLPQEKTLKALWPTKTALKTNLKVSICHFSTHCGGNKRFITLKYYFKVEGGADGETRSSKQMQEAIIVVKIEGQMDQCLFPKPMTLSFSPCWYHILQWPSHLPQTSPFMLARAQPSLILSIHINPSANHNAPPTRPVTITAGHALCTYVWLYFLYCGGQTMKWSTDIVCICVCIWLKSTRAPMDPTMRLDNTPSTFVCNLNPPIHPDDK